MLCGVIYMELKDICLEIAKKYSIDSIGIFGSRARGDFYETSDYDIFIIGDIDLDTELRLEYELEKNLDSEVDVIKINELEHFFDNTKTDSSGIKKPMLAKDTANEKPAIWNRYYRISKKLDGVRCMLYWNPEKNEGVS